MMKLAVRAGLGCLIAFVLPSASCASLEGPGASSAPDASDDGRSADDAGEASVVAEAAAPDAYTGPIVNATRTDTLLDDDWRFLRADAAGAETSAFDDAAW